MGTHFPELNQRAEVILQNISDEESKFLETLDKGEDLLEKEISKLGSGKTLAGDAAFKLYDTFGFPVDLTKIILTEKGYKLDEQGFEQKLEEAKQKAKSGSKKNTVKFELPESVKDSLSALQESVFTGYESLAEETQILELHTSQGKVTSVSEGDFYLIAQATPFYAESGGQAGDKGMIKTTTAMAEVLDVKKLDHLIIHQCRMHKGELKVRDTAQLFVNSANRVMTEKNHSATHLLHAALIKVCGNAVQQAGSSVDADKLRFDFSHKGPVSKSDLKKVEDLVNLEIKKNNTVQTDLMNIDDAKKAGAQALFGEKYDNEVRVLTMGAFSRELCGGTHVENTGDIAAFKIKSETGVSSGVRRIEAVTANGAFAFLNSKAEQFEDVAAHLNLSSGSTSEDVIKQIQKLNEENKNLKKKLKSGASSAASNSEEMDSKYGRIEVSVSHLEDLERNDLRDAADHARDKMKQNGICVFAGQKTDKGYPVLVSKTKSLGEFNAGQFLKELTSQLGGKGGGRPDFAQGTIDDVKSLHETTTSLLKI